MSHSLRTAHRNDEFIVLDAARRILPWNRWGTVAEFERAPGTWEIEWLILLRFSAPLTEEESDRPC